MAGNTPRRSPKPASTDTRTSAKRPPRKRSRPLGLRRAPLQSRAQLTFDHILDATARLLEKVGPEGLNTNSIARAAGINIATLYQYFPNKQAVQLALFRRQAERRVALARSLLAGIGRSPDWPDRIDAFVDGMARVRDELPGTVALMQSMRADPELREYNLRVAEEVTDAIASELVRAARLTADRARVVARCALEVNSALLDVWQMSPSGRDPALLDELKQLLRRYLAPYLAEAGDRAARRRRLTPR